MKKVYIIVLAVLLVSMVALLVGVLNIEDDVGGGGGGSVKPPSTEVPEENVTVDKSYESAPGSEVVLSYVVQDLSSESISGYYAEKFSPVSGTVYYCRFVGVNTYTASGVYDGSDSFSLGNFVFWEKEKGWRINVSDERLVAMDNGYTASIYYERQVDFIWVPDYEGEFYRFALESNCLFLSPGDYAGYVRSDFDVPFEYREVAMRVQGNAVHFPYTSVEVVHGAAGSVEATEDGYYAFFYRVLGEMTYKMVTASALCDIGIILDDYDVFEGIGYLNGGFRVTITDNTPDEDSLPQAIELLCLKGEKIEFEEG